MIYSRAYKLMRDNGAKISLEDHEGYWCFEDDTIMLYSKDGKCCMDIRQIQDIDYIMTVICRDDWDVYSMTYECCDCTHTTLIGLTDTNNGDYQELSCEVCDKLHYVNLENGSITAQ